MPRQAAIIADGSTFTESPRWHGGKLWYLDIPSHALRTVDLDGRGELVETFEDRPIAIDFLPDGTLLVALADARKIVRVSDRAPHADLSSLGSDGQAFAKLNDMVVDARGRIYISCRMPGRSPDRPSEDVGDAIAVVEPNGECRIATGGVFASNGLAISPDGKQLIAAETLLNRLVVFTIAEDGSLVDEEIFADLGEHEPDGICADSAGAIWASGMYTGQAVRVHADGSTSDAVALENGRLAIATMLGGPQRRHLFIASCSIPDARLSAEAIKRAVAYVEVVEVDVPGGGWPAN
jgi:sugar lactone lactonase YvrE